MHYISTNYYWFKREITLNNHIKNQFPIYYEDHDGSHHNISIMLATYFVSKVANYLGYMTDSPKLR